jgi:hypothetical protein
MSVKKLAIGTNPFDEIIDQNYFYVDKTKYIYDLLQDSIKEYFLSRPRRFGKTLLLNTLKELFSGDRTRFKDLWIGSSDYDFLKRPVISLSMSMNSRAPEILQENLLTKLRLIASNNNLTIDVDSPDVYFGALITRLYNKATKVKAKAGFNPKIAILIDEYDAPVTRMMDEPKIALANAEVLRDFYVSLKDMNVAPCVRFTFLTGVTRHGLTCTDSGPNHLNDISLDPKYAGLCGFTLEEFERLFADRMAETLVKLKKSGQIAPSANQEDLRAKILDWYGGYNWGGETRILNPFSILNFFENAAFENYWIQSGRPAHLTALIRERPMDFLEPKLESYLSWDVKKPEFDKPRAAPVLFHSGYLTLDQRTSPPVETSNNNEDTYSFRLPNYEVSSYYYSDCFQVIFNFEPIELQNRAEKLTTAIKTRNAKDCEDVFSSSFSTITYHQRPKDEKTFHSLTQTLLLGLGLNVHSELLGSGSRLDLCLELSDQVFAIIELRYCSIKIKLQPHEKDQILANLAMIELPPEELVNSMADLALRKLPYTESLKIISNAGKNKLSKAEKNQLLRQAALESLPQTDIFQALAALAKGRLAPDVIENALFGAAPTSVLSEEKIEETLSESTQGALNDIITRNYHGILQHRAKEIIDIGMVIYGHGDRV